METPPPSRRPVWLDDFFDWVLTSIWPVVRRPFARPEPDIHQETYDPEYYDFIESSSMWSRDMMADSIVRDLAPRNILDIGCGTGALMDALRMRDVRVDGLEYSDAAIAVCHQRALWVPKFDIARDRLSNRVRNRDVVISFEVAEHLPASLANRFVKLLTQASDTIVMSAATPGQGGTSHFNEQPHEYWIQKFAKRGYAIDWDLTLRWRDEWKGHTADWYHANVMVFRRQSRLANAA